MAAATAAAVSGRVTSFLPMTVFPRELMTETPFRVALPSGTICLVFPAETPCEVEIPVDVEGSLTSPLTGKSFADSA